MWTVYWSIEKGEYQACPSSLYNSRVQGPFYREFESQLDAAWFVFISNKSVLQEV